MTVEPSPLLSIRIRVATPADIAEMIRVVNVAFAIETFLDGTRTDETRMSEMMREGDFLVAQDVFGRIVASVYAKFHGTNGYLGMLAVEPSLQGTGLGSRMVQATEDHCRRHGCRSMDIKVLSLRPELLPFYRKLGYMESTTVPFLPPRPLKTGFECHCIVMSKQL